MSVPEMSVQELQQKQVAGEDVFLLDVRERFERDICHIGGELIPVQEVPKAIEQLPRDKEIVVYCRSGPRSADVVSFLIAEPGFSNVKNLRGGVLAWAKEIDPEVPSY